MKLNVAFLAFASVCHSALGQEQATFLRGSGAEAVVAEADGRASFGKIYTSHKQEPAHSVKFDSIQEMTHRVLQ
jgi:hypothetical protein